MKATFFQATRPPLQRDDWSLEDRARFNGLSEGYLLQFLSENKGALTTARRLGFTLAHSKPHQSLPTAAGGKAADATPRQRAADVTPAVSKSPRAPQPTKATRHAERPKSGTPPHAKPHAPTTAMEDEAGGGSMQDADKASTGNSKQRRAAKRSARHHALQLPHNRKIGPWLVMIFWVRLRRRARLRRALEDLEDLEELRDEMLDTIGEDPNGTQEELDFALGTSATRPPIRLNSPWAQLSLGKRERRAQGGSSSSASEASSSSKSSGAMSHGLNPQSSTRGRVAKRGGHAALR